MNSPHVPYTPFNSHQNAPSSAISDPMGPGCQADALREVTALRETLYQHSIVSVTDSRGRITEANPQFCAISGYTREELIGQDHRMLNSGHHPKSFWVDVWKTLATGKAWRGEVCNRAKDGSLYWVDSIIAPFKDANGKIERYVSIRNDITSRKIAEHQVAQSAARLTSIITGAEIFAWEFCVEEDRFVFVSFEDERLGYPVSRWLEPGFWDSILHPEDRERTATECIAEITEGRAHRLNYRMFAADGRELYISDYVSTPEVQGGRTIVRGVAIDVTDRFEAQRRIAESEHRLRTILDSEPACVKLLDLNGEIIEMNPAGLAMLECQSLEEVKQKGLMYFVLPEHRTAFYDLQSNALKGKEGTLSFEISGLGGTRRWLDTSVIPLRTVAGKVVNVLAVTRDITELRQREEELRAAKQAAETASRAKSAFLANMSHEIRSPLTAILGYADLLREDGTNLVSPEQRMQTIDTIRNAGQHLLTVINDILDLSKIEADKMTVERIETHLVKVLGEVQSLMHSRAVGKGITLDTCLSTPVPQIIMSDPTRLRQILMNLVGNAIKFTDAGSVHVKAGIAQVHGTSHLIIDIQDTGSGLTSEQTRRLFQSFRQADDTVTRKHGGTGLGLTICRRLAALMGGNVKLHHSKPGQGSCFRLVLPLSLPESSTQTPVAMITMLDVVHPSPAPIIASIQLQGRILLAEDGLDNQRLINFHLKKAGAEVDIADNGKIALELIAKAIAAGKPYDLLLTDMQMPEMDGYTLASTLRSQSNPIPIVALTAHAMAEDRARCIDAGCSDYTTKPIDRAALLAICARWMNTSSVGDQTLKAA